ncbi:MAG: SAF domain-containing protein [Propionibacteriaceae bacterium]|nr:SAF domain-containing protein [Propionibacteriaceae bacterium]
MSISMTPTSPQQSVVPNRRNPQLLAVGVLCIVLGGLGAAFAFLSATDTIEALAFTRAVSSGQQIVATDIAVVRINSDTGLAVMTAESYDDVVGSQALADISAGSLVNPAAVGRLTQPTGTVLLGLRLPYGRLPNEGLRVGNELLLVVLDDPAARMVFVPSTAELGDSSDASSVTATDDPANVNATDNPAASGVSDTAPDVSADTSRIAAILAGAPQLLADGTNWVINIWVADADATLVARMAAADRIALIGIGDVR